MSRQDVLIPFAMDARMDPDCLFIVFEEDFRFTPETGDEAWTINGRQDTSGLIDHDLFRWNLPADKGGRHVEASASSTAEPTAGRSEKKKSLHPGNWMRENLATMRGSAVQGRASREDWFVVSMFLRDLVAYAIHAHRLHRGEFQFMGWQPWGAGQAGPHINRFGSGAMLTMFSKEGARRLEYAFQNEESMQRAGHLDIMLRKFWSEPENSRVVYITPPVGGYYTHISGCEKSLGPRPREAIWNEKFACPGTRKVHDWEKEKRQKWWATFTVKGGCDWVGQVDIDVSDEALTWKTMDARKDRGAAEPTAGGPWSNWTWSEEQHKWLEESDRKRRAARRVRMNEKFRTWVTDEREA